MRLFLALDIPDADRAALAGLQRAIGGGRKVDPDLFHITLAYLGNRVGHREAEGLHEALTTTHLSASAIRLEGVGHFGHDAPDNIHVPVHPVAALEPLQKKLSRVARMNGLDLPRRKFVPHVTLVRYSRGDPSGIDDFAKLVARKDPFSRPLFEVAEVHLMQSHLKASGADYEVLASYPLS